MDAPVDRKGFLRRWLLGMLALVAAACRPRKAAAQEPNGAENGAYVPFRLIKGKPDVPPLDTTVLLAREQQNAHPGTHQVLSLVMDERHHDSYPWVQYNQLRTAHTGGDAVVFYSRLHKDGPGWSCGYHSEVFSRNWGVGIGVNIEMTNDYEGAEGFNGIYGIVIQAHGKKPTKAAIMCDGAQPFETGIDLRGPADVGINLHGNRLRLDEGTWIDFDADGRVRMRYYQGNIEFWNGDRRVAYIPMTGEDRQI